MSTRSVGIPADEEEEGYWLQLLSDLGSEPSVPMSMRPPPASPMFTHETFRNEEDEDVNSRDNSRYTSQKNDTYDKSKDSKHGDYYLAHSDNSRFGSTSSQHSESSHVQKQSEHVRASSIGESIALNVQSRQSYPDNHEYPQPNKNSIPREYSDSNIQTPNYPPPLPPVKLLPHNEQDEQIMRVRKSNSDDTDEDELKEKELPDMWGESDEYISDQIDFIFCSDDMNDYEDPYANNGHLDALAMCRSSLVHLQPIVRSAVGYAAGKVQEAGQAIYRGSTTNSFTTSRAINTRLNNDNSRGIYLDDSPTPFSPSLGSLHQTILFLSQHLDSAALSKYVRTASGTVVTLRDIAVMHIARYVRSNVYLSSFVGCVHESTLFMVDRLRAGVELYSHILQGDDPEKMHLELLKDKPDWQHLLLRCSMASLTWKQRQLLEETRDGGSINNADFRRLVQAQILEFDRQRVAKISKEFFYIAPAEEGASSKPLRLENVAPALRPSASAAASASSSAKGNALNEADGVNPAALRSILSDTASIDQLTAGAGNIGDDQVADVLKSNIHSWLVEEASLGDEDAQYALARFFTPPGFCEQPSCVICDRTFSITLFRHHCRFCGRSVCDDHSSARRCIYRYGLVTPVRVCAQCADSIDETHRMDAIIWRDLRVSAYLRNRLIPYFNPAVDRGIDKVFRMADYSITVARNALTYNFPAKLALDTVEVLKRYGLTGFTGLLLRKDFMESVELLKRISGMENMFSLSLHELTACVYYKLAIERGLRGSHPDSERLAHTPRKAKSPVPSPRPVNGSSSNISNNNSAKVSSGVGIGTGAFGSQRQDKPAAKAPVPEAVPVDDDYACKDAHNMDLQLAIRFAPLALNIIYEENPVDCQRLAKLQGWDTIFTNAEADLGPEQPCYTLFGTSFPPEESSSEKIPLKSMNAPKSSSSEDGRNNDPSPAPSPIRPATLEAVLVIRGTQTIQDVVTDIRAAPVHFPPPSEDVDSALRGTNAVSGGGLTLHSESQDSTSPSKKEKAKWDWLAVPSHHTYACGGMVRAAMHVLSEVGPALRRLQAEGYQITIVGHSMGGAVAALLTYMLIGVAPNVACVTYGCPSCMDAATSDLLKSRVLSVVLHDDVISRITPQSIRLLMRELMIFREQMFQHLQQEWVDVLRRASGLWTPRWRMVTAAPLSTTANIKATERLLSNARNAELSEPLRAAGAQKQVAPGLIPAQKAIDERTAHIPSWDDEPVSSGAGSESANINPTTGAPNSKVDGKAEAVAVMVEEEQLAQLWLPGRVMHIYIHNGQCFASEVSRNFPELRTIVLQGNIFEDHRSERILNALLEVRAVRQAPRAAPAWQSYHDSDTCACCHSNFTWNSTFTGQAQEFRDKYNCRYCGHLVCDPCSSQKRAMPQLGHMFPKRICDQCLYKGDFASI